MPLHCFVFSWQLRLGDMPAVALPPNEISYNTAISACAREGNWEGAVNILAAMELAEVEVSALRLQFIR